MLLLDLSETGVDEADENVVELVILSLDLKVTLEPALDRDSKVAETIVLLKALSAEEIVVEAEVSVGLGVLREMEDETRLETREFLLIDTNLLLEVDLLMGKCVKRDVEVDRVRTEVTVVRDVDLYLDLDFDIDFDLVDGRADADTAPTEQERS